MRTALLLTAIIHKTHSLTWTQPSQEKSGGEDLHPRLPAGCRASYSEHFYRA